MIPTEKRRAPRIQPFVAPCRWVLKAHHFPGYLVDLSSFGARVSCDAEPPEVGATVILEVRFGREVRYSRLPAEVKWVRKSDVARGLHVFGLTFSGVTKEERQLLESVVDEFQKRAAQLT